MRRVFRRLVLLFALADRTAGQGNMWGNNEMDQFKKAKPGPLNDQIPYLKCEVCKHIAVEARVKVAMLVSEQKPAKAKKRRFESDSRAGNLEEATEDYLQQMCDPENDGGKEYNKPQRSSAGVWITECDVKKEGRELKIKRLKPGFCRRECRTIQKTCEQVMAQLTDSDDYDEDLAGFLIRAAKEGLDNGEVGKTMCTKMSKVCKKGKAPLWPEGKPRMDEQFKEKDAEQLKLEKMMATMPGENGNGITMMRPGDYDLGGDMPVDDIDVLKEEL